MHTYVEPGTYTVSLTVSGPEDSDTVTLAQYITVEPNLGSPVLSVTPLSRSVSAESGTTTFEVGNSGGGTLSWSAVSNDSWLTVLSGSTGTDSGTIAVYFPENSGDERTGTITISSPVAANSPQTVQVIQSPNTGPNLTVSSPVAGDVWTLGSTYDIQWSASSIHGISQIKIYYHYSGNTLGIATLDTNPGVYSWDISPVSAYVSENARISVVAFDGNGDYTQVYSPYFSVQDSAAPPHPWNAPTRLTTTEDLGLYVSEDSTGSALAVDGLGNVHLIYLYVQDEYAPGTQRTVTKKIYYRKKVAGVWQTPEEIFSQTDISPDSTLPGYSISKLRIDTDSNNYPHISWVTSGPPIHVPDFSAKNQYEVYYLTYNETVWESPFNVSDNTTYSDFSEIAVDSDNNVHFVWCDGVAYDDVGGSSGTQALYHRIKFANGAWSATSPVINSDYWGHYPALARGQNGDVHLAYTTRPADTTEYRLEHSLWDGSSWSSPEVIESDFNSCYYKDIEVDEDNNIHIAYEVLGDFGDGNVILIRYRTFDGSIWSTPEIVSIGNNGSSKIPTIELSSEGYPQFVWYENSPDIAQIYYKQKTDYGWSSTIRLNTLATIPLDNGWNTLSAAIGNDDLLHVSWQSYCEGGDEVYYTFADITDDQIAPEVTVLSPVAGDVWEGGTTVPITWSAVDNTGIPEIKLEYTTDGGATLTLIASAIDNTGSYAWSVPDIASNNVQIYITATDIAGNQGLAESDVFSIDPAPIAVVADFVSDTTTGVAPLPVDFSDISTGTISSRLWVFGDGATSTERDPVHTYATPGTYSVSLTVSGPSGADTETKTDYITATPALTPTVSVNPDNGPVGTIFSFSGTGFTPGQDATFKITNSFDTLIASSAVPVDLSGSYSHDIDSNFGAAGLYCYSATDNQTGTQSNLIYFTTTDLPVLEVSPLIQEVGSDATVITFTVGNSGTGTLVWSAVSSDDWLSFTSQPNGTGDGSFTVEVEANDGLYRTGTIVVTAPEADNSPQIVTVNQMANDLLLLTPLHCNVAATGATVTLSIDTTGSNYISWNAASDRDWLMISGDPYGVGFGTVVADVAANEGSVRSAHITLTSSEAHNSPQVFTVNQMGTSCTQTTKMAGFSAVSGAGYEGIFPKYNPDTGWTGIVLINTGLATAHVNLAAYNDAGEVIATSVVMVASYNKVIGVVENFFTQDISLASYLRYSSDQPLVSFYLGGYLDSLDFEALPIPLDRGSDLYFPGLIVGTTWMNEFALINTETETVEGDLNVYDNNGNMTYNETVSLPPFGRKQWTMGETGTSINLSAGEYMACFEMPAQLELNPVGYMAKTDGLIHMALPALTSQNTDLYLPQIQPPDGNMWQGLVLVNTSLQAAELGIEGDGIATLPLTIPAHSEVTVLVSNLFSGSETIYPNHLVIRNPAGRSICGYEMIGNASSAAAVQLHGFENSGNVFYPHIFSDDLWNTDFVAFNNSPEAEILSLNPFDDSGNALASRKYYLAGKESVVGLTSFDLPPETAWLKLESTGSVFGYEIIRAVRTLCPENPADLDGDLDGDGADLAELIDRLLEGSVTDEEIEAFAAAFGRVN